MVHVFNEKCRFFNSHGEDGNNVHTSMSDVDAAAANWSLRPDYMGFISEENQILVRNLLCCFQCDRMAMLHDGIFVIIANSPSPLDDGNVLIDKSNRDAIDILQPRHNPSRMVCRFLRLVMATINECGKSKPCLGLFVTKPSVVDDSCHDVQPNNTTTSFASREWLEG